MIDIMWFRRDLRLEDNPALDLIAKRSRIAALYIFDVEIMQGSDYSVIHHNFIEDSVSNLTHDFIAVGGAFNVFYSKTIAIFDLIHKKYGIKKVFSNHETGNWITFNRDKSISKYFIQNRIDWVKLQTNGIIPGLKNRDGWSYKWNVRMNEPILPIPNLNKFIKIDIEDNVPSIKINNNGTVSKKLYEGGTRRGKYILEKFLNKTGQHYSKNISSPLKSEHSCSRLSPYLTYGNLSMRQIYQATKNRQSELRQQKIRNGWLKSLSSFSSRLRWHCHFIQKLEMQPDLEFTNMVRAFDNLRPDINEDYLSRWKNGEVGFPMVDACMRFLKTNGWINFRMRAMLVSFASYNLWIDWRVTSKFLSNYFIDYEPGIHYNQFQMQSGVTGINAIRIYNPIKQQADHDPDGKFVKRWCPELKNVPLEYLQYPHLMSEKRQKISECIIGKDYPEPVVDLKISSLKARKYIFGILSKSETKEEASAAYQFHGSRRKSKR
tara:strand:+ start:2572 stop:4044 length:1473 start_codon:yes stop_codon:yes gene_type:complete